MQTFERDCRVIVEATDLTFSNDTTIIHVLHVDDDPSILEVSKLLLMDMGNFEIDSACCVDEAFRKLATGHYDVVISDYEMPQKDGLQFLSELRKQNSEISFMLFTGKGREEVAIKALNLGADGYYNKHGSPETVYGELAHGMKVNVDRKKAAKAFKKQAAIIDLSPDGIIVKNMDETITFWSAGAEKLYGYKKEEALGQKINILLKAKKSKSFDEVITQLSQGKSWTGEITNYTKNNNKVTVQSYWTATLDAHGGIMEIIESNVDITQRKKTEESMRKSEERYRELANFLPVVVFEADLTGKITFFSRRAFELTGVTPEDVEKGSNIISFVLPQERERAIESMKKSMAGEDHGANEYTLVRKNGTTYPALVRTAPIVSENKVIGVRGLIIDITERKKAEEDWHESQQKFKALFSANPDAAVFLDTDFHVVEANSRFSTLFGYSLDEIKGKVVTDLIVPEDAKEESRILRQKILSGSVEIVTARKRKDGFQIPLFMSGGPVFVNGKAIGCIMVYKDISDIITVQEELSNALAKAELLNEKLRVVGSLTRHDVRNKLSTIKGYTYLLREKCADQADLVEGLGKIGLAVNDSVKIFEFAKMYEQLGVEKLAYVDVRKTVDEAMALFSGFTIKVVNDCQGVVVLADSFLRQMFYNFIDNTRKYGEKATIIKVHCEKAELGELRLVYEDDGVGISTENKSKLFKEGFSTGGSTGFGLFLTKKMMDVYDWRIQENGEPGEGAKFTITIPKLNKNGKANYQILQ